MNFTAPQRFLLESRKPDVRDYMLAISRRPGSLEYVLDKASEAGLNSHDLKALLGFAQKKGIIDIETYKYHAKRLDLQRGRTERISGRVNPQDTAIIDDDDDDNSVICIGCGGASSPTRSDLTSAGWLCNKCSGSEPREAAKSTSTEKTIDLH